ncbi:transglutaminase family protein [Sulfurimonas aquatica]|uniref:Transglutaminase family protein n=1 Tax=Sulfurimonas aquatica TaxID=2672570 RepID=A0A975B0E0_9BACT|nr:transglutaminase family protein [Sulfurimonas aquatica]QSZ41929.1 transglutaminase family protein [Sulfurimonas aquatica]
MLLQTSCDFTFDITEPTPFVLMLRPQSGANQWISSQTYEIFPTTSVTEFTDIYGNLCQRLVAPPGKFAIYTSTKVITSDYVDEYPGAEFVAIQNLPEEVLIYLLPSRYCESDRFSQMAAEITSGELLGYNQVLAIVNWMRNTISFEPNISDTLVSAIEVKERKYGVCRDFSHLAIAMCRSLSIPTRMVVGYLHGLEPMDLHAWFEAYVGNRWYTFDATQAQMKGGYVAIGYGRDAADVAIYNQFGPSLHPATQHVHVEEIKA